MQNDQATLGQTAKGFLSQTDLWLAVAVVTIILMLFVPLPAGLLNGLLILNLALALTVLLTTAYVKDALEFSVFPSLLLSATLFRIGLSIAVARAILSHEVAGDLPNVVHSVGNFVLGNNPWIGFALFLVLIIVQFVVVTGGSGRVAEVAARFTLDAMPGKQMSIDADLNSGLITEDQARARRQEIETEADFYGAMDGAAKFVRGDAIAALVVTAVVIVAGVLVGILQRGLPALQALDEYGRLTVGQGLAIQIPALLISVASGLIVTRTASDESLSADLAQQLCKQPQAFYGAGLGLFVLGLALPGWPTKMVFVCLSTALFVGARALTVRASEQPEADQPQEPEDMIPHLRVEALELELGFGLVSMASGSEGNDLLERITAVRRKMAGELGLLVPPIRVRDNLQFKPNEYSIKLRGVTIAGAEVLPGMFLAMGVPTDGASMEGIPANDPAFGLPAIWVALDEKDEAERKGYTVVDAESVLITHLSETLKAHAHEVVTRQEVATMLESVRENHPAVVDDLIPELLSRGEVQNVFQNLLQERVSIRDLVGILEALAEGARTNRDIDFLTELTRLRLARTICETWQDGDGLNAIAIDPEMERQLGEAIQSSDHGITLVPEPSLLNHFVQSLSQQVESVTVEGWQPVLVCSRKLRLPLRRMVARFIQRLPVISYEEAAVSGVNLKTVGIVSSQSNEE